MSFHRENITWQSQDGTWSIGFWSFTETGDPFNEDHDPEWNVEYSHDTFWFASTGHASAEAAQAAYTRIHVNPGGGWEMAYSRANAKEIRDLNQYAWNFFHPAEAKAKAERAWAAKVRREQAALRERLAGATLGGFQGVTYTVTYRLEGSDFNSLRQTDRCGISGDWVTIGGKRVYNPSTGRFGKHVVNLERQQTRSYYGWR